MKKIETKSFVIVLLGATFLFYAYLQANIMPIINIELADIFKVNSAKLSMLSSTFFYSIIFFMIPAGLMLDRYSVKSLIIFSLIISVFGSLMFAFTVDIRAAIVGRFLCGVMMAFALITCYKLAAVILPTKKMGLFLGLITSIGMIGGTLAPGILGYFSLKFGWQGALLSLAVIGIAILLVISFFVTIPKRKTYLKEAEKMTLFQSLVETLKSSQNWRSGFFASFLNYPMAVLAAYIGMPFLMQMHGFSFIEAKYIISMLFIGLIIGAPIFGLYSDMIGKRRNVIFWGLAVAFIATLGIVYSSHLSSFYAYSLFFIIGFAASTQILAYSIIIESNPPKISGTALSFVVFLVFIISYIAGIPLISWVLENGWTQNIVNNMHQYSSSAFKKALLTLPIAIVVSIFFVMTIKETKCKAIYKKRK